jgi:tetratricopeptide (TPR) repeat protein
MAKTMLPTVATRALSSAALIGAMSAVMIGAAPAQQPALRDGQGGQRPQAQAAPQAPATLQSLYDRLKAAASPEEAQAIVRQIARRWNRSGSETADLLMTRAKESLARQQAPLAVELLDRVIAIQPAWAEAWHVRGMAFFVMQDDFRAIADFRETLRREPGHFMALGMTAAALQRQGDQSGALRAFRAVEAMNPHFGGVKDAIEKLKRDVDGRDA